MKILINITVVLCLIIIGCNSLKAGEVAANDWHLQNIGEVTDLHFAKNKLFFLTQLNVFGHLNKQDGAILTRYSLNQNQRVIQKNNKQIIIATQSNQIIQYRMQNLQRIVQNRFMTDKILKRIKSYVKVQSSNQQKRQIYLNDQISIKYLVINSVNSEIQNKVIHTAESNEIFQKVFIFEGRVCISSITDNKLKIYTAQNGNVQYKGFIELPSQQLTIPEVYTFQSNIAIVLKNNANQYKTVIVNSILQIQKIIQERPRQLILNQLIFSEQSINMDTLQQSNKVTIYSGQKLYTLSYEQFSQQIIFFINQKNYAVFQKNATNEVLIHRTWINSRSDFQFELIVQFSDMKLALYKLQNNKISQIWHREESFAYINKVLFMKYPYSDHLDNEYHRNLYSINYQSLNFVQKIFRILSNLALRVKQQLRDFQMVISDLISKLLTFKSIANINFKQLAKFSMSEEEQLKLGLKKYVVVITNKGTIYSIDTKTSEVQWKINRKTDQKLISLIKLRRDYQLQTSIMVNFNQNQGKIYVQQIKEDGTISVLKQYQSKVEPTVHKLNQESILIKVEDKILRFDMAQSHGHEKHYYFYTEQQDKIVGWKQEGDLIFQIWNFHLGQGQNLLATATSFRGDQQSKIPLFDNDKVIFKNIDFTNLAVLTNKNATSLSLYILNGKTGQVQFNQYKTGLNLNHAVNLVYDENNVLVTYYNNRNKIYQIWTVEQYQERIQTSAIQMIKDYLEQVQFKPSVNRENIIFLSQVYGFPLTVKKMFISESKMSLIRRNMIVVTRDNKLYILNRQLVSTRRPKQTALFQNEKYPPYMYMLPYEPANHLSYDLNLISIQNMRFSSSDMESTIFVFGYGIDNFMIRTSPDKPFDMITEDFNYLVLILIICVVTVGVMYLRNMARKARMIKPHRD